MLADGLIYMAIGMTIVFSFLLIMVFTMMAMSKVMPFLATIWPEEEIKTTTRKRVVEKNDEIAVVIAAVRALG